MTTASAPSVARELELLVAQPVGDDRGGRAQARDADRERAHRADADDADRLGRLDPRSLERLDDARAGLDERRRLEGDVVGKRMEDARRHDHELAPAAAAREADRVVALAEMRVAGAAARAAHAADVPLADDPLARLDGRHALADRVDDAAPLVAGDDREAHPARVERAGRDVEVGPADAGDDAPDANLARSGRRRLDVPEGDRVRPLDDDRSHRRPSLSLSGCRP